MRLVIQLLGSYPYGDKPADSYVGALAAILRTYPRFIVTDIGKLARECKFLPTIADVVAWCERESNLSRKPLEQEDREEATLRARAEDDAWQKARLERPTLDELKAQFGPNWGIKGSEQDRIEDERKKAAAAKITEEANRRAIAAMDAEHDWNTAERGHSWALAELVKAQNEKIEKGFGGDGNI